MTREAKILIAVLVVVVGGLIGLFVIANGNSGSGPTPSGAKVVIRTSSHKEGSGPVQMVEFGDYQCPACGAAFPNVQQLLKDYNGKITFYFRNFPLTQLHPNAMAAAEAAEAAAAQGKFWQMHDKLYETQNSWADLGDPTDTFVGYAGSLGLDTGKFRQAIENKQFQNVINQDIADGNAFNIDATPTFFFNGTQFSGGYDYTSLRNEVQSLLK